MLLPLSWWLLLLLPGIAVVSLYYVLHCHILKRGRKAVKRLIWDAQGTLKLLTGQGQELDAKLCSSTFVSRWLILLNLRTSQLGNHSLVLLPDSLTREHMRQLRVRIRQYPAHDQYSRSFG